MKHLIPLQSLRVGEPAHIRQIVGQPELVHRLRELGFHDGALVERIQTVYPCLVRLDGQKIGLRADDMVSVLVHPTGSTS